MALDLSRIFGGYTRTWRLASQQAQSRREGNHGKLREFRILEYHPLGIGSIFWSKRDLVQPELASALEEPYMAFAVQIRDFKDRRWRDITKEMATDDLLTSWTNGGNDFCGAVKRFLEHQSRQFTLEVLGRTGFYPNHFPPYILNSHTQNACKIVFPEMPDLHDNVTARFFVEKLLGTITAPLVTSIRNHAEHLSRSAYSVDWFNAELFYLYLGLNASLPDSLRKKIDKGCPLVITEKDTPALISDTARIDNHVWVVAVDDVDPLFRQRIKDADPSGQCRHVVICTETLNHSESKLPGFLLIPSNEAVHLSIHKDRARNTFSTSHLVYCSGKSLSEALTGVAYFDIFDERNLNYKLESALVRCEEGLISSDGFVAQQNFYAAQRALEEIGKRKYSLYDIETQRKIDNLKSLVANTAEAAVRTLLDKTWKESLILEPAGRRTQIAPCFWIETGSFTEGRNLRIRLTNTKTGKEYEGWGFIFIHEGKVYTYGHKDGMEIHCYNPVASNNIMAVQARDKLSVYKADSREARLLLERIKTLGHNDRGYLAQAVMNINRDTT